MENDWSPQFVFVVCQPGAERALKNQLAEQMPNLRPAFSRPGFVTFKLDQPCTEPSKFQLNSPFARTFGFCLGKVTGDDSSRMARDVWSLPEVEEYLGAHAIDDLHVFSREKSPPGDSSSEPGPTLETLAIEGALRRESPLEKLEPEVKDPRDPSRRNRWVMDVIVVESGEWWVGCHRTNRRSDCWPGGVTQIELPEHAVSRAYLKMQEALEWSALPMSTGDVCLELGCAPGGASQTLLDAGLTVIGVDPAEVNPLLLEHPDFTHVQRRAVEVPRKMLQGVAWLAADINAAPAYTLDAVEAMVTHSEASIRGMIVTLKLSDWNLAAEIPKYLERIRSWGYRDIRVRQLAFNGQEICVVALRSRGQRRMLRKQRRRRRFDRAESGGPKRPHSSHS